MQGYLESCRGSSCPVSCCSRGFGESREEYERSLRKPYEEDLADHGITFTVNPNDPDLIWWSGCSGESCGVLRLFPEVDTRALACKIFPYKRFEVTGGGRSQRTIGIALYQCPATDPDYSVPQTFTDEVMEIVRRHYLEYFNEEVDVEVIEKPQEC